MYPKVFSAAKLAALFSAFFSQKPNPLAHWGGCKVTIFIINRFLSSRLVALP